MPLKLLVHMPLHIFWFGSFNFQISDSAPCATLLYCVAKVLSPFGPSLGTQGKVNFFTILCYCFSSSISRHAKQERASMNDVNNSTTSLSQSLYLTSLSFFSFYSHRYRPKNQHGVQLDFSKAPILSAYESFVLQCEIWFIEWQFGALLIIDAVDFAELDVDISHSMLSRLHCCRQLFCIYCCLSTCCMLPTRIKPSSQLIYSQLSNFFSAESEWNAC